MSTDPPKEYLVSLTFRREGVPEAEGYIALVEARDEDDAFAAAHDKLIFGFGFDDVDPATVARFAVEEVAR
jgi:hypothetical protein